MLGCFFYVLYKEDWCLLFVFAVFCRISSTVCLLLVLNVVLHNVMQPYIKRFEANLKDLDNVYNKCLTNFINNLALYPRNQKLAELSTKYK